MTCGPLRIALAACFAIATCSSTTIAAVNARQTDGSFVVMPVHSYLRKEFGTVRLELTADSEGNASEVCVLESSGHPRLDTAAFHQVSSLSISSGELTEDMRNGRVKKQVQVTFPARLHNLSDDRIAALTAMTCGEAMADG